MDLERVVMYEGHYGKGLERVMRCAMDIKVRTLIW